MISSKLISYKNMIYEWN